MFPIYKNDQLPLIPLTDLQTSKVKELIQKIQEGSLKLIENKCLCGKVDNNSDIKLSNKDMFGLPCCSLLCKKCGLIRSDKVFDTDSNIEFYINYYRPIYSNNNIESERLAFQEISSHFIDIIPNNYLLEKSKIVEIGCASGAHLYSFHLAGHNCEGYDYDEKYLAIGRSYGLKLFFGSYEQLKEKSVDLILLSHVMEHFTDVIKELNSIILKIKDEGMLLIEVPGIFYMDNVRIHPLRYIQNAHVVQYYYKDYLNELFEKMGLKIIYANERCTFLLRKPLGWHETNNIIISTQKLEKYPKLIEKFIKTIHFKYLFSLDSIIIKRKIILLLDKWGIKPLVKKIFSKFTSI